MDQKVNKAFFIQTCEKINTFLKEENVENKIIQEIINIKESFDLLTIEEQQKYMD